MTRRHDTGDGLAPAMSFGPPAKPGGGVVSRQTSAMRSFEYNVFCHPHIDIVFFFKTLYAVTPYCNML